MALIIEDGTGVAGADSYGTRAGFIAYALSYYGETIADDDSADTPMRRGFNYMNSLNWEGSRTHKRSQVGALPRTGLTDCDDVSIGTEEIFSEAIQAQYEFARAELASIGSLAPSGTVLDGLVTKEKVDVIEVNYDTSKISPGQSVTATRVEAGMALLECFLTDGGSLTPIPYAASV